jgi:N12 class adenine-specific DNA methylase
MTLTVEKTLQQLQEQNDKLQAMLRVNQEREQASADAHSAALRWNDARARYALLYKEYVEQYGTQYAPIWLEQIHGPRNGA